jgi:NAD-dependent SIR2 family protein deacetylase
MDNGGIPQGAFDHEKPFYYRDKYNDACEEIEKLKGVVRRLREQHEKDTKVIKQLKDHLHETIGSIEEKIIANSVTFICSTRCPHCGIEYSLYGKE